VASDPGVARDREPASDLRGKVRQELDRLKGLAERVTFDEVRRGEWLTRLLKFSLDPYVREVDAATFDAMYPGLSTEAKVQARIDLAASYASVAGALTAGAYTGAIAATLGTRGSASAVTLPAAGASFVLDLLFVSSLQLRLAYDIAVIRGVPLDLEDPEDLWRLITVAFLAPGEPTRWQALARSAPVAVRPILLRVLSGDPAAASRSLPAMGRFLLQRSVLKFAVPGLGVPVAMAVNHWSAKLAGRQAAAVFGREARIMATARRLAGRDVDPAELLRVLWLVAKADGVLHEHERLLLKHVAALVGDLGSELSALVGLDSAVDFDLKHTVSLPAFVSQDTAALYEAAVAVAAVDGSIDDNELSRLRKIAQHCSVPFQGHVVRKLAADEAKDS
jgi:tellurite resistance protein